jgi:hypothetical protein
MTMTDQEFRENVTTVLKGLQHQVNCLAEALPRLLAERDAAIERELARKLAEALDYRDRALRAEFVGMSDRDRNDWGKDGGEPPWTDGQQC